MSLPKPVPGLVIRYSFLWQSDHRAGRDEGRKDRPCAIVAAVISGADERRRVLVLPITHAPPRDESSAFEIPSRVRQHLKLGDERSWIVLTDWNGFVWPGPDLRRVGEGGDGSIAYGMLPPDFFVSVRAAFLKLRREARTGGIMRSQ